MRVLRELGQSSRVVLLKAGGIGDFLSITPALRALRAALPQAELVAITSPSLAPLARRFSCLDQVLETSPCEGISDGEMRPDEVETLFRTVQAQHFDLAIQLHGGGKHSNPFVKRLGARATAGFRASDAEPLDHWIPYDVQQHEVLRALDLINLLGAPPFGFDTWLPSQESDLAALATEAPEVDLNSISYGRYLGVHPGASRASRRRSPERYARVADQLLQEFDLEAAFVTAVPGQEAVQAEQVVRLSVLPYRYVNLAGRLSLDALVGLVGGLRLLVTNDSGPSHMAVALGTPCVIVYGSGPPLNWAPLLRAYHRPVADWTADCRWFADDGCADTAEVPCLRNVTVQAVLEAARQVMILTEKTAASSPVHR